MRSQFDSVPRCCSMSPVAIPHTLKLLLYINEFGSILRLSLGNRHFSISIDEAFVLLFLNSFMLVHQLEMA